MASVTKDDRGWRIRFYDPEGARRTIRPGRGTNKATAEQVGRHIDHLVVHIAAKGVLNRQTAEWLGEIATPLRAKLVAAGLADPNPEERHSDVRTVASVVDYHIDRGRTKDGRVAGKGTIKKWQAAAKHLKDFFKKKPVEELTAEDAERFRDWLSCKTIKSTGKVWSENNVRSVMSSTKMFFNAAKRRKWVVDNPFENEVSGTQENKDRSFHVNQQLASKVLASCPDTQWRLMFSLWRFTGLRKMEIFGLRWEHVLWDKRMLVVPSNKTAHLQGREERVVPIAEIQPVLEEAFHQAEEGTQNIITRYHRSNSNLDKPFRKILQNGGVTPWPKLFQNLRASCETDWLSWVGPNGERNAAHVVASWVGHSIKVQNKHYAQVDEHHFENFNGAVMKNMESTNKLAGYPSEPRSSDTTDRTPFATSVNAAS